MKKELYGELRALVLAHQEGEYDRYGRPAGCSHCESRWTKIKAVLDRIVDNAEAIREDDEVDRVHAEAVRQKIENLRARPLRPRRR